jgi:lipopolysaccharide export system permease protein
VIIDRYIMREILKPTAAICLVLVVIYGSSMATRYWEDAVQGLLAGATVLQLILCRVLISLEVLLPTTFYLAVVIALGRFAASGELTAMSACGIGTARVTRAVALLACLVAATVAVLSLSVRPWAWTQFFLLKARAEARFDLTRMQGGNFYELGGGNRVLFADRVDTRLPSADQVFVLNRRDGGLQVIYAARAAQSRPEAGSGPAITLENGSLYEFPATGEGGVVLAFTAATMRLRTDESVLLAYRVKAAASRDLLAAGNREATAELQWRLAAPLASLLLGLVAVPLSRSTPRGGQQGGLPAAIRLFAAYYNVSAIAKKLVAQGAIGVLPGVFWGQILLVACLLLLNWRWLARWRRT